MGEDPPQSNAMRCWCLWFLGSCRGGRSSAPVWGAGRCPGGFGERVLVCADTPKPFPPYWVMESGAAYVYLMHFLGGVEKLFTAIGTSRGQGISGNLFAFSPSPWGWLLAARPGPSAPWGALEGAGAAGIRWEELSGCLSELLIFSS